MEISESKNISYLMKKDIGMYTNSSRKSLLLLKVRGVANLNYLSGVDWIDGIPNGQSGQLPQGPRPSGAIRASGLLHRVDTAQSTHSTCLNLIITAWHCSLRHQQRALFIKTCTCEFPRFSKRFLMAELIGLYREIINTTG